jgi:hypothetical protein
MVPCDRNATECGPTSMQVRSVSVKRLGKPAVAMALSVLLASCGGEAKLVGPATTPPQPPVSSTPAPRATPATSVAATPLAASLGPIVWTSAVDPRTSAPTDTVTAYAPDARRIIAVAPVRGLPRGSTVAAAWFYNDTSLDSFATQLTMTGDADQTWVSFYIERREEKPWPSGTYEIAVSVDGTEIQRASVEVTSAP